MPEVCVIAIIQGLKSIANVWVDADDWSEALSPAAAVDVMVNVTVLPVWTPVPPAKFVVAELAAEKLQPVGAVFILYAYAVTLSVAVPGVPYATVFT